jgi:hypothetical protein
MQEEAQVAESGMIPPGFYDAGAQIPLRFRKPLVPYYLAKIVVNRFTSMLFSAQKHPEISCDDSTTEDWLNGFAAKTRLWAQMILARRFGGAMGTAVFGFKFVQGAPYIEVFDPRWCTPIFLDREQFIVDELEIRYQFVEEVRDRDGRPKQVWFWYRRIIDDSCDKTWPRVPVGDGEEPDWDEEKMIEHHHDFGFCPVVWVQNQPVLDDIDGDPDCHGIYEFIQDIDALHSQASRGTKANCDPSLIISSNADFDEIQKGTGNALQVEQGGSITYAEINGSGIDKALTLADRFEEKALTVVACTLDRNEGGPSKTEKEVDHNYSAMIDQADILREQYGEKGVKRLLELVIRAVRKLDRPKIEKAGADGIPTIIRSVVKLPKRRVENASGEAVYIERQHGKGEVVELKWPDYFTASTDEVSKRVEAASKAKEAKLIDHEHATKFVSKDFSVENVPQMMKKMEKEKDDTPAGGPGGGDPAASFLSASHKAPPPPPQKPPPFPGSKDGGTPAPPGGWGPRG